jgi:tetratricopeptide (TPR) repeat protein
MTDQRTFKRRVRARMAQTGERYTEARAAMFERSPAAQPAAVTAQIEAVVLRCNSRSLRVRILGESGEVTLRLSNATYVVPGQIVKVAVHKRWTHLGFPYAAGALESIDIDVARLGLEPLGVERQSSWAWGESYKPAADDPYLPYWRRHTASSWPVVELDAIASEGPRSGDRIDYGDDVDDLDFVESAGSTADFARFHDFPVSDAAELHADGDVAGARELLMQVLHRDLRCIDAHAHLGNLMFDHSPTLALAHYRVGVAVGDLSIPPGSRVHAPWSLLCNRPLLRALHGMGLCEWRLGRFEEAKQVFERMIALDPRDGCGARFGLFAVLAGQTWEASNEEYEERSGWRDEDGERPTEDESFGDELFDDDDDWDDEWDGLDDEDSIEA